MNAEQLMQDLAEVDGRRPMATGTRSMDEWRRSRSETAALDGKLRRPKKPRASKRRSSEVDVRAALEACDVIERIAVEEGVTLATEVRGGDNYDQAGVRAEAKAAGRGGQGRGGY